MFEPPGEPWEPHLGEVRPKSSSYTKCHKTKIIGRVDILVWENCKNLKINSHDRKNIVCGKLLLKRSKLCFLGPGT